MRKLDWILASFVISSALPLSAGAASTAVDKFNADVQGYVAMSGRNALYRAAIANEYKEMPTVFEQLARELAQSERILAESGRKIVTRITQFKRPEYGKLKYTDHNDFRNAWAIDWMANPLFDAYVTEARRTPIELLKPVHALLTRELWAVFRELTQTENPASPHGKSAMNKIRTMDSFLPASGPIDKFMPREIPGLWHTFQMDGFIRDPNSPHPLLDFAKENGLDSLLEKEVGMDRLRDVVAEMEHQLFGETKYEAHAIERSTNHAMQLLLDGPTSIAEWEAFPMKGKRARIKFHLEFLVGMLRGLPCPH